MAVRGAAMGFPPFSKNRVCGRIDRIIWISGTQSKSRNYCGRDRIFPARRSSLGTVKRTFRNGLQALEATSQEPGVESFKCHAPGIGLVKDAEMTLKELPINPAAADLAQRERKNWVRLAYP